MKNLVSKLVSLSHKSEFAFKESYSLYTQTIYKITYDRGAMQLLKV